MVLCLGERAELLASGLRLVLGGGDSVAHAVELGMRFLDDLPDALTLHGWS